MSVDFKKWLGALKSDIGKAIIGLIVVFLVAKWDYVVSKFDAGVAIEEQSEFNNNLAEALETDSIVAKFMENDEFITIFFESSVVQNHIADLGKELRNSIVEDVTRSDTNKISMRSFVGKEADIRDEQVLPLLAEIIKAWKDGDLMTEKDVEDIIKRRRRSNGISL
jgi:hypothetical protein